jgi:hypothetical protein
MSFALLLAIPAMAFADDIYNNLDPTIDSNVETTNLTAGGANGTVNLHVDQTNGDGKNGCNLTADTKLVAAVNNSDASVATVSASSVEFTSCGTVKELTVSPLKAGETTISLSQTTNTTGGSFNLAPATFKVVVAAAAPTQKDTSLNVSSASGTYGGTTNLSATLSSSSTGVSGKSVAFTLAGETVGSATTNGSGVATLTDVSLLGINAGPHPGAVVANFAGDTGYKASLGSNALTVDAKQITGSFTANDKEYDGNTSATVTADALQGVLAGDTVSLDVTNAKFDTKNVGTAKTVSANLALSGAQAGNYSLSSATGTDTADISAKSLTGSFTAADKVYDGNDSATVTGSSLPGAIAGDVVSLDGGTAKFSNKNVGTDKPVTLTGASLVGADKGNYTLGSVGNAQADITARDLTVSATGINKTYDGNASATVNLSTNELSGDTVTANYTSASFANKNVGTGKPVSVNGISISGADAANYNLTNATASTTADITARGLVVTATAANKTYDGTNDATVSLSDNRVSGDVLSASYASASFDNANAGTGKVVTVSGISVTGADSGNYTFNTSTTTSANIAQRAITVTADAKTKLFGDPDPALTYQHTSGTLVGSDQITGSLTRAPGETTGQHAILQGSVSAGPNYAITYVGANLTIGAWTTKGFYAPVDMGGVVNTVKGGSTVPMKFELFKGATELKDVSAIKSTTYSSSSYCGGAVSDEIEVVMTGSTSLRFDATGDQFIYNWKTPTGAGCYKVTMTAQDGSTLIAYFKTR